MPDSRQTNTTQSSAEHQPSDTALATATMRALAAHDERQEIRGPDYLAETFLTEDRKSILKDSAKRQWVLKNKITPGAYEFMIARTAFFDAVVNQALRENVPQNTSFCVMAHRSGMVPALFCLLHAAAAA